MKRNGMSDLERAVYDLADAGALDASHALLYARPIGRLARAGLLTKDAETGAYRAVRAASDTRPPSRGSVIPAAPPEPKPVLGTLVCRVPEEWLEVLDAMGPSRSEAARVMLGRALANASGARRKVG